MPPIRVLAEELTINPNTVARAYLELERAGIVYKKHGSGTYVAEVRSLLPRREKVRILTKRADTLLTEALHLGIDFDEVVELLRERHETMKSQPSA
jgi:GntR family transcriptional regulator